MKGERQQGGKRGEEDEMCRIDVREEERRWNERTGKKNRKKGSDKKEAEQRRSHANGRERAGRWTGGEKDDGKEEDHLPLSPLLCFGNVSNLPTPGTRGSLAPVTL